MEVNALLPELLEFGDKSRTWQKQKYYWELTLSLGKALLLKACQ